MLKVYTTNMVQGEKITESYTCAPDTSGKNREMQLVRVFPQYVFQTLHGFGGAFTDAAGYVYSLMDEKTQQEVVRTYFSPDEMGYVFGRTSIDSSDFGTEMYAADDDPADEKLEHMDFSRGDRYVLPLYRDASAAAGQPIQMMLTPRSPPAYMKDNGSRVHGGKLLDKYAGRWAEYICLSIVHAQQMGMDVRFLTMQNEPLASQTWDSCIVTGEEERKFLESELLPALKRLGLTERVGLLIWDHNKELIMTRADAVFASPKVLEGAAGIAFHWYTGDHFENLSMFASRYSGKRLVFSEGCVEHSVFGSDAEKPGAVHYAHEYIGDLLHGADTFIEWNLLLDEQGGPNHVGNFCDAPMMYDRKSGKLYRKLSLDYIGHFSRYMKPGSRRIGTSTYAAELETAAVKNPDGSIATVILNRTGKAVDFFLQLKDTCYPLHLDEGAILTAVLEA